MRPIDGDYISDALEAELCREGDDLEDRQWAYGYAAGVSFAVRKLAEAPTLTPPNEWVSVEERLPEVYLDEEDIGIPFLVCGPYTKYPFRAFFAGTFWHDCFEPVEVTHWMPLPAPPDRRPPEGEEERHGD